MNKIKEIREMTGLSQSKFAKEYGIPVRTLQNWEIDKAKPPAYLVTLLERVVKTDLPIIKKYPDE